MRLDGFKNQPLTATQTENIRAAGRIMRDLLGPKPEPSPTFTLEHKDSQETLNQACRDFTESPWPDPSAMQTPTYPEQIIAEIRGLQDQIAKLKKEAEEYYQIILEMSEPKDNTQSVWIETLKSANENLLEENRRLKEDASFQKKAIEMWKERWEKMDQELTQLKSGRVKGLNERLAIQNIIQRLATLEFRFERHLL